MSSTTTMTSHAPAAASAARSLLPAWYKPLFVASVAMLALTGFGQMPIYSRYYVSSIPGLGWTADFYLTHTLHYGFAALFLALLGYVAVLYLRTRRPGQRLNLWGLVRVALYVAIAGSGVLRVLKNLPELFFDPVTVMLIDWGHLLFVLLLGAAAVAARLRGSRSYT